MYYGSAEEYQEIMNSQAYAEMAANDAAEGAARSEQDAMQSEINWDDFKCRCSAISKMMATSRSNPILTEKQSIRLSELENKEYRTPTQNNEYAELLVKKENSSRVILSDTCIEYLMEEYSWRTVGKLSISKEMDIEQMQKGRLAEEEAITLLCRIDKVIYTKNTERVSNDFLSGEPDVFAGEEIMKATRITDIKNCWDYPIFLKKINNGVDNGNTEQVQGYCDITGAPEGEIAFTLVDMPEIMRTDYKRRIFYRGNYVTEESPDFLEKWEKLERSMMFEDILPHKRVFKIPIVLFTEFERQKIYDRVKVCREWLWKFDEMYQQLNIPVYERETV